MADRVKVTFFLDVTDPGDSTGLTSEDFDRVHDEISAVFGGDEIEIKKVSE
jgi:hypothetical protein